MGRTNRLRFVGSHTHNGGGRKTRTGQDANPGLWEPLAFASCHGNPSLLGTIGQPMTVLGWGQVEMEHEPAQVPIRCSSFLRVQFVAPLWAHCYCLPRRNNGAWLR